MEVYKSETREVIGRFLHYRLNYANCICSLDAAVAALIPRLQCKDLPVLRGLMVVDHEKVMKEMKRRAEASQRPQ